jgi:hypothetical protein
MIEDKKLPRIQGLTHSLGAVIPERVAIGLDNAKDPWKYIDASSPP